MLQVRRSPIMRTAAYVRVSTNGQVENGYSLPEQRANLEHYCARHGHQLVEIVADEGLSGRLVERPGLSHILALAQARQIDAVVAVRLDRLGRENRIAQDTLHKIRGYGVRVEWVEHGG